jgi:hypothetical protein
MFSPAVDIHNAVANATAKGLFIERVVVSHAARRACSRGARAGKPSAEGEIEVMELVASQQITLDTRILCTTHCVA